MRLGSMTDVANPSGRPDMGGSASPSTTRAGAAGCGVTGLGVDGLGATETGIILPTFGYPPLANPVSPLRPSVPQASISGRSLALRPAE